ncbi:hypothetical protein ACFQMJ_32010, partial [Cohnella cellulosilytica]
YLRMKVDRTFCNGRYAYVPPGQFDIEIIPRLAAGRGRKSTVAMTMPFPQLIDSFCQTAKCGQLLEWTSVTAWQTAKCAQLPEWAYVAAPLDR